MTPKSRTGISPRAVTFVSILGMILLLGEVGATNTDIAAQAQQPSGASPQEAVASLVSEWLGYLSNESVSGLTSLYAGQANLTWGGTVGIFGGGDFSGQSNVRLLYSALFENTTLFTVASTPVNTTLVAASTVNATFGLVLGAQRGSGGTYQFEINVSQQWVDQSGAWRIQDETWTNNAYDFNAVTSTETTTLALGSQWVETSPPPFGPPNGVSGESCVTYSDFLYCVGGGSGVYYAQLGLDGGVGSWKNTTSYPLPIEYESCVSYTVNQVGDATILCVGGDNSTDGNSTDETYAAQLSPDGGIVGSWQPQVSYPTPITGTSCVVDSGVDGYIAVQLICVGGDTELGDPTSAVYYAPVWQDGSGDWVSTTSFPVPLDSHSCVESQVYIYCVGGLVDHSSTDSVYYAEVTSSGGLAGGWNETAPYPIDVTNTDCVTSGGYDDYAFCIGGLVGQAGTGDVFYARLSHTGAGIEGSWMRATSSAAGFDYDSCVEAIGTIWCDWGGSVVYDEILGPDAPTVTQTVTVSTGTATLTETATSAASSSTTVSQATRASLLPEVYGLFAISVAFAASTVYFATKRRS